MVERVETGIPGLDDLVLGGIPKGSVTLVTGGTGTGKTLICSQFLKHGIDKKEKCIYLTLEEEPEEIIQDAHEMGWNFDEFVKRGLMKIEYLNPLEGRGFESRIEDLIDRTNATRIVIDSTSVMGMYSDSEAKIRERLYNLVRTLRRSRITALVTAEIPEQMKESLSRYGVEEFVSDGVIVLHFLGIGAEKYRNIEIRKMRRTNHKKGTFPMDITTKGIVVYQSEEEYAEAQGDNGLPI